MRIDVVSNVGFSHVKRITFYTTAFGNRLLRKLVPFLRLQPNRSL
jgi:hypothetical protein